MSRILVIDDNEDLREMMRLILVAGGYDVEVATDGNAGITRLEQAPCELVITDIFMPDQDGLETIARLRASHPEVRIIAVSGGGKGSRAQTYLRTAIEIGAHASLSKPFPRDELLATVRRVLSGAPPG